MKLVTHTAGRVLVAGVSALLILIVLSTLLLPGLRGFIETTFVDEKNYVDEETHASAPVLTAANTEVRLPFDSEVDIFDGLTATSSDGTNLIDQLKDDFAKSLAERSRVFIYKMENEGQGVLSETIDSSVPGEWTVFYVLADGNYRADLKVHYVIGA